MLRCSWVMVALGLAGTVPGRELMDYWVQSFRWLDPKKRPPVCEYFDPESSAK